MIIKENRPINREQAVLCTYNWALKSINFHAAEQLQRFSREIDAIIRVVCDEIKSRDSKSP